LVRPRGFTRRLSHRLFLEILDLGSHVPLLVDSMSTLEGCKNHASIFERTSLMGESPSELFRPNLVGLG
jgi:hypothetical protein